MQAIETTPKMSRMLQLADKNLKTAIINMFIAVKENILHNKWTDVETQQRNRIIKKDQIERWWNKNISLWAYQQIRNSKRISLRTQQ